MNGVRVRRPWSDAAHRSLLMAVALLAVLLVQIPKLAAEFRVDEDFRSFYWTARFRDPELFPEDPFRMYSYVDVPLPWGIWVFSTEGPGYGALFQLASLVVEPIHLNKMIGFLLAPIAVWYLSRLGESVGDRRTGTLLALVFLALNLASPTSISVLPGLRRSFVCPLIIAHVYYLHRQRYGAAAVILVLSTAFYAPAFVLAVVTWALYAFKPAWPLGAVWRFAVRRGLWLLLIGFLVGLLLLAPYLSLRFGSRMAKWAQGELPARAPAAAVAKTTATTVEGTTPTATKPKEHLLDNPVFGPGGRVSMFEVFPVIGRAGIVPEVAGAVHLAVLLVLALLTYAALGRPVPELPRVLWCLLGASVLKFALAWGGIVLTGSLLLYLPSRYTSIGLFVTLLIYVLLNARAAVANAIRFIRRRREQLPWAVGAVELGSAALLVAFPSGQTTFLGVNLRWALGVAGLAFCLVAVLYVKRPALAGAAAGLGAKALLHRPWVRCMVGAALLLLVVVAVWLPYAWEANLFLDPSESERSLYRFLGTLPKDTLLAGTPCALDSVPLLAKRQILFSCEQVAHEPATVRQALLAYYSSDADEVIAFCRQYGIDYLVVHKGAYAPDYLGSGRLFFEPYNDELVSAVAGKESFALAEVPEEDRLFQAESLYVVACETLGESR